MAILLSHRAKIDLDEIRDYTIKTWDYDQWVNYYQGLILIFNKISNEPMAGKNQDIFQTGLLSIQYKQHIIFFFTTTKSDGKNVIIRILGV